MIELLFKHVCPKLLLGRLLNLWVLHFGIKLSEILVSVVSLEHLRVKLESKIVSPIIIRQLIFLIRQFFPLFRDFFLLYRFSEDKMFLLMLLRNFRLFQSRLRSFNDLFLFLNFTRRRLFFIRSKILTHLLLSQLRPFLTRLRSSSRFFLYFTKLFISWKRGRFYFLWNRCDMRLSTLNNLNIYRIVLIRYFWNWLGRFS